MREEKGVGGGGGGGGVFNLEIEMDLIESIILIFVLFHLNRIYKIL